MKVSKSFAKPYAKAIFDLAKDKGQQDAWLNRLDVIESVFSDPVISRGIAKKKPEAVVTWIKSLVGTKLDEQTLSLMYVLLENRRIASVPDIKAEIEDRFLKAQGYGILNVTTSVSLNEDEKKTLLARMEKLFGQKLKPHYRVDQLIKGGVVGRVGDLVFDGSVKGSLEKMNEILKP